MAQNGVVDWIIEHLLKLVELFVIVPIGIWAALLALFLAIPWKLARRVLGEDTVSSPPDVLTAVIKWPYRALAHIFTGAGGFQWTPRTS